MHSLHALAERPTQVSPHTAVNRSQKVTHIEAQPTRNFSDAVAPRSRLLMHILAMLATLLKPQPRP